MDFPNKEYCLSRVLGNTKQEIDKLADNQPPQAFDRFTCIF